MDDPDPRSRLRALLEIDSHPLDHKTSLVRDEDGYCVEEHGFVNRGGENVRGFLTRPQSVPRPLPAILYIHAHGDRYEIGCEELLAGRPALQGPLGPVFARGGRIALCIDLPCFGQRSGQKESAAAKAALWRGRTLAGQMLGEIASSIGWLAAREDVDSRRIAAFGISMGATFGYWLAAVDPRISCVAHLCCYADFAKLIETGAHDLHGLYLTVPGLPDLASNGVIAGMIAPRPQLICIGDRDPLTPPDAVDIALAQTRAAYERAGVSGNLEVWREPGGGHQESEAMRATVLDFFARRLVQS